MSEIEDRRQRAREAFWDTSQGLNSGAADGVRACVEVATQVKITDEAVTAFLLQDDEQLEERLYLFLTALGFEVID